MDLDGRFWLSIMHLLVVVPLFLYIGIKRADTPPWLYLAILTIGLVILVYHGFRLIVRLQARSNYWWVNSIHVGIIAPLLLYIGWHKKETPRFAYELLLMLGFAAGGYHLFSLVKGLDAQDFL